ARVPRGPGDRQAHGAGVGERLRALRTVCGGNPLVRAGTVPLAGGREGRGLALQRGRVARGPRGRPRGAASLAEIPAALPGPPGRRPDRLERRFDPRAAEGLPARGRALVRV